MNWLLWHSDMSIWPQEKQQQTERRKRAGSQMPATTSQLVFCHIYVQCTVVADSSGI